MQGQSTNCDMWPVCACTVNLRCIIASREPAAARLPSLILTLKEVKEMQGKCSIEDDSKNH